MEDSGRLPPAMALASPSTRPKALALPGLAAKSAISLLSSRPVPGTAIWEPKLKLRV